MLERNKNQTVEWIKVRTRVEGEGELRKDQPVQQIRMQTMCDKRSNNRNNNKQRERERVLCIDQNHGGVLGSCWIALKSLP